MTIGVIPACLCLVLAGLMVLAQADAEAAGRQYLQQRNTAQEQMSYDEHIAAWAYESNLTEENKLAMMAMQKKSAAFEREEWKKFQAWREQWQTLKDQDLRRQFKEYSIQGLSALPESKLTELNGLVTSMTELYSKAKVNLCVELNGKTKCSLSLEPELTQLMAEKRDYAQLQDAWVQWRAVSGKRMRAQYQRHGVLANEAARLNGFSDMGAMWRDAYESETFPSDVEQHWQELRPLYLQLHAYVRRRLREVYGEDKVSRKGPIPAHLLGNMWAQTWNNIDDLMMPYPSKPSIDVTQAMKNQGYTPKKMFQLSDTFFRDLNLTAMPSEFWQNSIIEKPVNTELVCHASAWDFSNRKDVRIKMCTNVNMEDLITIHHEMGHIQYYLQYKHQPYVYRSGANPGFHEAVGDALALSVQTPEHLHKIGLLDAVVRDQEADINFLMSMALSKVVFLPFGYMIDRYRWDVFSGAIPSDQLNCGWWNLRSKMQGIKPPVKRTEEDFDAGAKYHVAADVPYIRYFVSFIVQFQFHKAMCLKAGQYDPNNPDLPLHRCDIDKSVEAGNALASMLQLGASRPWPEALERLTGSSEMDGTVLREYFRPLEEWLLEDNARRGEHVGWEDDEGDYCG